MSWFLKKTKKTRKNLDRIPNLEDMINNLSIISQASHQLQQPTQGDPTIAQDQIQMDLIRPSAPQDLMDTTMSSAHHQAQVDVSGAGPSLGIPHDSMIASSSTPQDHMQQEDIGQVLPRRQRKIRNPTTASIGQDQAFNQVCSFLRDDEVGMIGIYGMGGIGKTTLMKKIREEYLKPSNFRVIWVVVSKTIDVDNIQKVIMKEMDLPFDAYAQPYQRAEQISKALGEDKVALLLDDIWERVDLEELGILGPSEFDTSICKVLFTSRSEKVCIQMEPDEQIKVECLGWNDSWALFEKSVGRKTLESDHTIESIAKEVAKECRGLPLALTVIGRAMMWKKTPHEWEHAFITLQKSSTVDKDTEKQLFARLRLSYDTLPVQEEKNCFLYCCLYPEDWEVDGDQLIEYWIAEGVLALNGNFLEVSKRGADIIGTLQAACLLERLGGVEVKLHDVIRDMGLWIASELNVNFFVHGGSQLTKSEIVDKWREAHRIYVLEKDGFPEQPVCLNLTTLIKDSFQPVLEISNSFFNFMGMLRVLKLRDVKFLDQKVKIGQLQELRYLSIHRSNLGTLPMDIIKLHKLEVLDLVGNNNLTEFPEKTIRHLIELRKLTVEPWSKALSVEVGFLFKLEILRMQSYKEYCDMDLEDELCERLPVSKKKETLELCNPQYRIDFVNNLSQLSHSLRYLDMGKCTFTRPVEPLSALQPMVKLVNLMIDDVTLPEVLIFTCLCLPSLKSLNIANSSQLKKIQVSRSALQNIRELEVIHCYYLNYVVGLQHLKSLVKLTIESGEMKELIEVDEMEEEPFCFPSLKYMKLVQLRDLETICSDNVLFPSITTFVLRICQRVNKLPRGLMNENRTLRECEIWGTRWWWRELMWPDDDDGFKSFILERYRPLISSPTKKKGKLTRSIFNVAMYFMTEELRILTSHL